MGGSSFKFFTAREARAPRMHHALQGPRAVGDLSSMPEGEQEPGLYRRRLLVQGSPKPPREEQRAMLTLSHAPHTTPPLKTSRPISALAPSSRRRKTFSQRAWGFSWGEADFHFFSCLVLSDKHP